VGIYWDAVLNHKAGADEKETCKVTEVDMSDRNKEISEPFDIDGWLGFTFPGRGDKYSKQKYHWHHFTGTDYDARTEKQGVFKICGENKGWSESVDKEQGNADYMMFADLDYHHPEVVEDVKNWGVWIVKELGLKGFRLDAVQHFSERFTADFVNQIEQDIGEDSVFFVGEFWVGDAQTMCDWLEKMNHRFSLYDAPLLYNFSRLSTQEKADLRGVFDGSLVKAKPVNAVVSFLSFSLQAPHINVYTLPKTTKHHCSDQIPG
jgi:alpha-amylase